MINKAKYFRTLNPLHLPPQNLVQGRYNYSHPLYNSAAIRSQSLLPRIQNTRGISYCGAWTKYGFHEDGFSSGIKVAQDHLGAQLPFQFKDSTFSRGRKPVLGLSDLLLRLVILIVHFFILMIERVWDAQRGVRRKVKAKARQMLSEEPTTEKRKKKYQKTNGFHE